MMLIDGMESELVPASDRGLLYGDGLFETIAVRNGLPQRWPLHLQRLHEGCARLGITAPDDELLRQEALKVCVGAERGVLKIIVTRGDGGRGYRPPRPSTARRILALHPWPEYHANYACEGIEARLCTTPLAINPLLAGLKHLNRLEQVLARSEWDSPDIAEGIMLDTEGNLVEGTMSNLFLVQKGRLLTPTLERCGVAGIMRAEVLGVASSLGLPSEITRLDETQLVEADEVFFTNSIIGIWPLRKYKTRRWQSWPITQRLSQRLNMTVGMQHA